MISWSDETFDGKGNGSPHPVAENLVLGGSTFNEQKRSIYWRKDYCVKTFRKMDIHYGKFEQFVRRLAKLQRINLNSY